MSTQSKVSLGIFWDIENCSIPLRKSSSSTAKQIRDWIASKHPECGYAQEFSCACDATKLNQSISEGLHNNGVNLYHVNSSSKNAADAKLEELIDTFIDKFGSGSILVVITGDINFNKSLIKARKKDILVVLIHGSNCSQDLRNSANETYLYNDLLKDVEDIKQNGVNQTMPAHLKVFDLPKEVTDNDIRNRLSKLSENCGGKVVEVGNGSALIRFMCRDDAQRALQRMNGENCFGQKLKLSFNDSKVVETNSLKANPVLIPVSNDCKSVIRGIETKKDQNVAKLVRKIVSDWKDSQINPNLIVSVERNTKKAQEDGIVTLFVTAVNAEANQKLINGAKQYIHSSHSIKWTELRDFKTRVNSSSTLESNDESPIMRALNKEASLLNLSNPTETSSQSQPIRTQNLVSDDCKSVIKGLETKKDQNVAKVVRKLVSGWNDSEINANFIVSVERNSKQSQVDGKVTIFVTATNSETSKKLVNGAKKYINPNEKIHWNQYKSRKERTNSTGSDESMLSNTSQALSGKKNNRMKNKFTENELKAELSTIRLNMKLFAGFLFDNNSDANLLKQLYVNLKSMQTKYIIKYENTFKNSPINVEIQDIKSSLENLFNIYEKKFGKPSLPVKDQSTDVKIKNMSVILGLYTKPNDNVLLLVRSIISRWNDQRILAQDVTDVSRDSKWKSRDGKAMLFVTAKNRDKNRIILRMAENHFNDAKEQLVWNKYSGKNKAN